MIRCGNNL